MKPTAVISAFPACGKSYCFNNYNGKPFMILDSDSSEFSWVKDERGNNTKERNPDFPSNYMKHIKDNIGKADVIFVSSHKQVRQALRDNSIAYFMIYPDKTLKEEWLNRMRKRGNNTSFIEFMDKNFELFIDEIEEENQKLNNETVSVSGLKYTPQHSIKLLHTNSYITNQMLDSLFDNSMGNLSCMWWNH